MKRIEDMVARGIGWLVLGGIILTVVVGGPVLILWLVANGLSRDVVQWWAILATLLLIPAFFVGFWFGKTEVRGFLSGVDTGLDRLAQAVNMRDTARLTVHREARQTTPPAPSFNVLLPTVSGLPSVPVTHRQLADGDDVIDL